MKASSKALFYIVLIGLLLPNAALAQENEGFSDEEVAYITADIDVLPNSSNINVWLVCLEEQECTTADRGSKEFLFDNDPDYVEFEVEVYNPFSESADYYLLAKENGGWQLLLFLDSVEPYSDKTIFMPLWFEYAGFSNEKDDVAIVAVSSQGKEKYEFSIFENWQPYERLQATLLLFGIPVSLILGVFLIVLVAIITAFVFFKRKPSVLVKKAKQYTLKSLFIPSFKGKTWKEDLSLLILHPLFWLIEIAAGLIIITIIFIESILGMSLGVGFTVFFIGGICAMASPIAYLFIGWLVDWYEREPLRFIVAIFFWGFFAAFISFFVNTIIGIFTDFFFGIALGEAGFFFSMIIGAVIVAPVVEETSKGFGVLLLSANKEMNDVLDGILYGFGVGMGFAAIENWLYFTSANPAAVGGVMAWAFLIFNRSLFAALGHGWMTATTGAVIAFLKTRLKKHSYLYFIPAVILAMIMHGIFNFIAFIDGLISYFLNNPIPIFDPILVFGLTIIFGIIIAFQLMKNRAELFGKRGKAK